MSTLLDRNYTRDEARKLLGIRSPNTLTKYCDTAKIARGFHYFTEPEFQLLKRVRAWREKGGRYCDFPYSQPLRGDEL